MTKEELKRRIEIIEAFIKRQREISKTINSLLQDSSGIFTVGDEIIDGWIEDISELSGIHRESLEWYIYDGTGRCKHSDGFEMDIRTPADLWEFENHEPIK